LPSFLYRARSKSKAFNVCHRLVTDSIGSFHNPRLLHLFENFLIKDSGSKGLLDCRDFFFFSDPQTLEMCSTGTSKFVILLFVLYWIEFSLLYQLESSFSLFLFLFFSFGRDNSEREFCFAASFYCTMFTMFSYEHGDAGVRSLSEQILATENHELLINYEKIHPNCSPFICRQLQNFGYLGCHCLPKRVLQSP